MKRSLHEAGRAEAGTEENDDQSEANRRSGGGGGVKREHEKAWSPPPPLSRQQRYHDHDRHGDVMNHDLTRSWTRDQSSLRRQYPPCPPVIRGGSGSLNSIRPDALITLPDDGKSGGSWYRSWGGRDTGIAAAVGAPSRYSSTWDVGPALKPRHVVSGIPAPLSPTLSCRCCSNSTGCKPPGRMAVLGSSWRGTK